MDTAAVTKESVENALKEVKYPGFSRDIVSFGLLRGVEIEGDKAVVSLEVTTGDESVPKQIKQSVEVALGKLGGLSDISVQVTVNQPKAAPGMQQAGAESAKPSQLSKVKYAVAVSSGKGGVGKSTVSVNLACALEKVLRARKGEAKVGLMDCDIYGPSTPLMIGLSGRPEIDGENIVPMENFGVKVMSMGFLIDEEAPVVWRGPMIMKTIQQFATNVSWGELDVLVIDLPPGTGDAQLSLVQTIPLDGALVVTTPQAAAVNVARRGARMFDKVNVPILGVVENMSYLMDGGGGRQYLFGQGGGEQTAKDLEAELMGQIPLEAGIREGGDRGIPAVVKDPESSAGEVFMKIAQDLLQELEARES